MSTTPSAARQATTSRAAARRKSGRRLAALVTAGAVVAAVAPLLATSADAASTLRVQETGTVRALADGDTPWVDIAGDGTSRAYEVRLAGVQSTETKHRLVKGSKNWCHGQTAKTALSKILLGKKVQLRALHKSSRSQGRILRYVFVKVNGTWTDVQKLMLEKSQLTVLNFPQEPTNNKVYGALAQKASLGGRGVWNPTTCGSGPSQSVPLRTWVHWDAQGIDEQNLNDEYVVIENRSPTQALSLNGWMVRDTSLAVYKFPSWAKIAPNSYVKLHVGKGTNRSQDFYWKLNYSLFQNPPQKGNTDFAILMDARGDWRSWGSYPCRYRCGDPLAGKLAVTRVVYDPDGDDNQFVNREQFTVTNNSDATVRLSGYHVLVQGWLSYTFSPGRELPAHSSITVHMGKGDNTSSLIYMKQSSSHLVNAGGTVEVKNWNNVRVSCQDWGNKQC